MGIFQDIEADIAKMKRRHAYDRLRMLTGWSDDCKKRLKAIYGTLAVCAVCSAICLIFAILGKSHLFLTPILGLAIIAVSDHSKVKYYKESIRHHQQEIEYCLISHFKAVEAARYKKYGISGLDKFRQS